MQKLNVKLWYKDGSGMEKELEVEFPGYIPDTILYGKSWWKKTTSSLDLNDGTYTKVHYEQEKLPNGDYYFN